MGRLTLVLGGARSGKSAFAQRLAEERGERLVFVATAQGLDAEMAARIEKHRLSRSARWKTMELPLGLEEPLPDALQEAQVVVLDCLTLLVSNLLLLEASGEEQPDEAAAGERVAGALQQLLTQVQDRPAEWIVVSNEVGMGLVPANPLGRMYRDLLGRANQQLAARADEVYWVVAGIPLPMHPFRRV